VGLSFVSQIVAALVSLHASALQAGAVQAPSSSWLDRALANWNRAGQSVTTAPPSSESSAAIVSRCKLTPPASTRAEQAVQAAGWIPFWNFDQQLVRDDVEIVGGMSAADGMCRPMSYNLFVFVSGRFAGTLSPAPMNSRSDSSSGVVRVQPPTVTADFSRYTSTDPLCCPSSRVTLRYRVDRSAEGPLVVPVEIRTTRP
jgi:hypothetical protein